MVFDLVMFAIALMGAGFAPLVFVQVMNWRLSQNVALLMVVSGVGASIAWRVMGYHVHVFDSLAGMLCPGIALEDPSGLYFPTRGPSKIAPIKATHAPVEWTTVEPAKSHMPISASQPPPQIQ